MLQVYGIFKVLKLWFRETKKYFLFIPFVTVWVWVFAQSVFFLQDFATGYSGLSRAINEIQGFFLSLCCSQLYVIKSLLFDHSGVLVIVVTLSNIFHFLQCKSKYLLFADCLASLLSANAATENLTSVVFTSWQAGDERNDLPRWDTAEANAACRQSTNGATHWRSRPCVCFCSPALMASLCESCKRGNASEMPRISLTRVQAQWPQTSKNKEKN